MDLKNLLKAQPTEITVEYLPGFRVTLAYIGLPELERALDGRHLIAKGGKVRDQDGVNGALRSAMVRAIKNWEGLDKDILLQLNLDLDPTALEAMGDAELPCTNENKVVLLRNDAIFMRWVQDLSTEIKTMRELEVTEQAKNSPRSQSGQPGLE